MTSKSDLYWSASSLSRRIEELEELRTNIKKSKSSHYDLSYDAHPGCCGGKAEITLTKQAMLKSIKDTIAYKTERLNEINQELQIRERENT